MLVNRPWRRAHFGVMARRRLSTSWLVLAMFPLMGCASSSHQPRGWRPTEVEVGPTSAGKLPTELEGGYLFAWVHINDRGPFRFLVDTGSGAMVISPETARAAGVVGPGTRQLLVSDSPDGSVEMGSLAAIDSVRVGGHRLLGVRTLISSLGTLREDTGLRIDGILGFPLLDWGCLTIDFGTGHSEMAVQTGSSCLGRGQTIPLRVDGGGTPQLPLNSGEKEIWFTIDSGSQLGVVLDPGLGLPLTVDVGPTEWVSDLFGAEEIVGGLLGTPLRLGNVELGSTRVQLSKRTGSHLGMGLLRAYRFTFDSRAGVAWIDCSSAADESSCGSLRSP
jgi:hypothetical protein